MQKKCFIVLYKNLLVSRRKILDLSQSIRLELRRHFHFCSKCQLPIQPALPHNCLPIQARPLCTYCKQTYKLPFGRHLQFLCPQKVQICHQCQMKIPKKIYEQHFQVCLLRTCSLCSKKVPAKCYAYHYAKCELKQVRHISRNQPYQLPNDSKLFQELRCRNKVFPVSMQL